MEKLLVALFFIHTCNHRLEHVALDFKELVQDYQDPLPDLKTRSQVEEWRENVIFEHLTPWFHHYRAVVSKYIGASEHETFNHPVASMPSLIYTR